MTDQLLDVLKLALLALVYLFFGRVLWAVWSEVRTPVPAAGSRIRRETQRRDGAAPRRAPKGAVSFVVLEPRESRGERHVLADTLTIGRDASCSIPRPDDQFVSAFHARIETRPDGAWICDLGSTNGTTVNGRRVEGERRLRKGDRVQAGSMVMEMHA